MLIPECTSIVHHIHKNSLNHVTCQQMPEWAFSKALISLLVFHNYISRGEDQLGSLQESVTSSVAISPCMYIAQLYEYVILYMH